MKSRVTHGKIICPIKFDNEQEELMGNQKYVLKSFEAEKNFPSIKIHTASGKAVLIK